MEELKPQKRVQIDAKTWILIDADRNEEEAKYLWRKKHDLANRQIDLQQRRRELITIRGGRVMQRTKHKK